MAKDLSGIGKSVLLATSISNLIKIFCKEYTKTPAEDISVITS